MCEAGEKMEDALLVIRVWVVLHCDKAAGNDLTVHVRVCVLSLLDSAGQCRISVSVGVEFGVLLMYQRIGYPI